MQPSRTAVPCTVHRYGLVEYEEAQELQRSFVARCRADGRTRLLLLEHPPTYTFGARARPEHLLLDAAQLGEIGATVHETGRGGDITYHGPGQLVAYPILNLHRWRQGPRWYVRSLEEVLIQTLASFEIAAHRYAGRPGVWIGGAKIAAIGVRISRGVTSHGFALNVDPDLSYFTHIVPCGLPDTRVTSMSEQLGRAPAMDAVMDATAEAFARIFPVAVQQPATAEATA